MKTMVVSVGRMNPPTIGHLKLIEKMKEVSCFNGNAPLCLVITHTHDNDRNPLTYEEKHRLLTNMGFETAPETDRTIYQAVERMTKEGIKTFHIVIGKDRHELFEGLCRYKEKWGIETLVLHEIERADDSCDALLSCSATKVREAVRKGDRDTYNRLIGVKETDKECVWNLLRERLTNQPN